MSFFGENSLTLAMLCILICLFAFFAASETALLSLNRFQVARLNKSSGTNARLTCSLLKNPSEVLISILIGNLTVEILYFCIFTVFIHNLPVGEASKVLTGIMSVVVIILFGEILPKSFAIRFPVTIASISAAPVSVLYKITKPLRFIVDWMEKRFSLKSSSLHGSTISVDELKMLLGDTREEGEISDHASDIIENIITLSTLRVKYIMIPRPEVIKVSKDTSIDILIDLAIKHRCFNISVWEGNEDNPVGYVNIKDIYFTERTGRTAADYLVKTRFVPETKLTGELLTEMISENIKLVHIVDEYGDVSGILTTHNILRSLIGSYYYNIETSAPRKIEQLTPRTFRIQGSMPIHAWQDIFENMTDFRAPAKAATIGGFLTFCLGRLPKENDTIRLQNLTFTVENMINKKIGSIKVSVD